MKIGIVGTGRMGSLLGEWWLKAGHEVRFSLVRHDETPDALAKATGREVKVGTPQEVTQFAEVILLAVPCVQTQAVLESLGSLQNKILLDVSNQLVMENGGWTMGLPLGTKAGEIIAAQAKAARVVKAYNTVGADAFREGSKPGDPEYCVFMSGDDNGAKEIVANLIRDSGFAPVDLGLMRNVDLQEPPTGPFYGRLVSQDEARRMLAELERPL